MHVRSVTFAIAGAAAAAAVLWFFSKKKGKGKRNKVAILDAGAQYGKLIDRRIRELKVQSIVLPLDTPAAKLKEEYAAIVISGGPGSCYAPDAPGFDPAVLDMGIPVLGVCYGYQLMNYVKGGKVTPAAKREDLQEQIDVDPKCKLFRGMKDKQQALLTHGDSVKTVAQGFQPVSWNSNGDVVAIARDQESLYGVQFHPEVDLTEEGTAMFTNFLFDIAQLAPDYTPLSRHQAALEEIRGIVGEKEVLVLVSGGVDSSVCAALCKEAVGEKRVHAVHVDHGFMRLNESELVQEALGKQGITLHMVRCSTEFEAATTTNASGKTLGPLGKITSPEDKRMIIGDTFMRITDKAIADLKINPDNCFLAQGTLRPDLIESGSHLASSKADVIKTHHNDTALVRKLRTEGKIVEPLKDYHKDEVRALGEDLGLPHQLVWRQPFPGPGLAIRALCSDGTAPPPLSEPDVAIVTQVAKEYKKAPLSVCELPVRSVGVQGDKRSYKAAIALSLAQETPAKDIDWPSLFAIARRIPSDVPGISRTCFMWGPPVAPSTSSQRDVTPTYCSQDVMDLLRKADAVVTAVMIKYKLEYSLSQVPVVLLPCAFDQPGARSIVIRPFITRDFMTGKPAVPGEEMPFDALEEMIKGVRAVPGIVRVCYDLTSKPPGTTEWE